VSDAAAVYERKPVVAPRLVGFGLRAVVWLAESSLGGALRNKLVKDAGILELAKKELSDAPEAWPVFPELAAALNVTAPDLEATATSPTATPLQQFETIADFAEQYRTGATTPEVVAERLLAATRHSDELTPPMRFFIAQRADDVMVAARQSTERWKRGEPCSVLEGVPIAVKDELDQVPYATSVGTRFLGNTAATVDSTVVAKLRRQGALLIGKTNMHEIGIGVTGLNPHHGTARNPFDPGHHTGGSSSGSAAVVAAGLCPAAVAADGGGSIRIPAGLCGVVGLKPTFGRVSEFGAAPLCWSVAHLGPVAISVRDAATLYAAMAGPDPQDPHSMAQPPVHLSEFENVDLRGLRVGVFRPWFEHAQPEVVSACEQAIARLIEAGATLHELPIAELALARVAHLVTIGSEMTASQSRYFAQHLKDYGHDTRLIFALVRSIAAPNYVQAQRARACVRKVVAQALAQVDVIATPAAACVAPPVPADALRSGESNLKLFDELMRFALVPNLTGLPAISFPAGYSLAGLPIGLQLIGAAFQEHLLLRMARVAEQSQTRRLPRVHYRLLSA
jgi:Asp-tRNA(Asn)/Glu-tRNA(Gln) amidotransferase A subunit family amidase